jgi:hypothetical protein
MCERARTGLLGAGPYHDVLLQTTTSPARGIQHVALHLERRQAASMGSGKQGDSLPCLRREGRLLRSEVGLSPLRPPAIRAALALESSTLPPPVSVARRDPYGVHRRKPIGGTHGGIVGLLALGRLESPFLALQTSPPSLPGFAICYVPSWPCSELR